MKTDHDHSPLTDQDVAKILLDWSSVFMRRSMHDFMAYTRTNSISMPQINVLMWLYYHKSCEVMQLEEVMQVSRPAASQMVERMVQQGLVNRTESPTDRRSRLVTLSDRGIAFIEEAIAARRRWLSNLVETFTPEQKNMVAMALKLLSEHAIEMDQDKGQ